jgi:hypothetical protein
MVSAKDKTKLDELHQHFDPKCDLYGECDLEYITVDVMNEDGVIDKTPVAEVGVPPNTANDPWWVKLLRAFVGCK